ncbi:hypothetical protein WG947_10310 [Pontibacter sp. H259]|uniref:hypothetical protein n=1 Tax=Pontibacter sp. H259 TaxID=3133421 RepID=UPI0030C0E2E7
MVASLQDAYKQAVPAVALDTLIANLNPENYRAVKDTHFENVVINVGADGELLSVFIPKRAEFKTTDVYDIYQIEYLPTEKELTVLQKDIVQNLKQARKWMPAKFIGVNVRNQIFVQVYFRNGKPAISNY